MAEYKALYTTADYYNGENLEFYDDEWAAQDFALFVERLQMAIGAYETRFKTKIAGFGLDGERFSRYGSIGGNGARGGYFSSGVDFNDFKRAFIHGDETLIGVSDGVLEVANFDHDGRNTMQMYLVTETELHILDRMYYDAGIGGIDPSDANKWIKRRKQAFNFERFEKMANDELNAYLKG